MVVNGAVQTRSFAKLAAMAYLMGAGCLFVLPVWVAALVEAVFGSDPNHQVAWIFVVAVPFLLIALGAIMFVIVLFGLRLLRHWQPTKIAAANDASL